MSDIKKCQTELNKIKESFSEILQQLENHKYHPVYINKTLTSIKDSQQRLVNTRILLNTIIDRTQKLDPISGLPRYGPTTMRSISEMEVLNIFSYKSYPFNIYKIIMNRKTL